MRHFDIRLAGKIGNGAGYFQNPIIGTGRQPQFVDGRFEKCTGGIIQAAVLLDMPVAHPGIGVYLCTPESIRLYCPGSGNPLPDILGRFSVAVPH